MKALLTCLLASVTALAHAQGSPEAAKPAGPYRSVANFGLAYPLSSDWIRATRLLRKKVESSDSPKTFDILLAAVYVPKSDISTASPFFSLYAYRQPATDCKGNLEAMISQAQNNKEKPEGGIVEFSAAGREYFRVNTRGPGGRYDSTICTTANGHLLVWNAGAPNEKGLRAVVSTLNSITALPEQSSATPPQSEGAKNAGEESAESNPAIAKPERVQVARGVVKGFKIKDARPSYPPEARSAGIQGTVVLQAEISKSGDIADLELVDGPVELAGSAVAAVRQWKYKPYLLCGEPVAVDTEIQVNYQLH